LAPQAEPKLSPLQFPDVDLTAIPRNMSEHFDHFFRGSGLGLPERAVIPEPVVMVRERKSAQELADLITAKIGVGGLFIRVRKDHAYGWEPQVEDSPGDKIYFQRRAEEIANRLRRDYELRE
jgi:hypothetical protein